MNQSEKKERDHQTLVPPLHKCTSPTARQSPQVPYRLKSLEKGILEYVRRSVIIPLLL